MQLVLRTHNALHILIIRCLIDVFRKKQTEGEIKIELQIKL
jgi:hypothetical protein